MGRKYFGSIMLLILLMGVTAFVIIKNNDMGAVYAAIAQTDKIWIFAGVIASLFFVAAEGSIIWYLLQALHLKISLLQCVGWSFIGFFFSGITPSATGGQPAQLYYMNKAGIRLADSTPVLMVVAILYKFILAIIGILITILWRENIQIYFAEYTWLFFLGIILNTILVAILVWVMVTPRYAMAVAVFVEKALVKICILKPDDFRMDKIQEAVAHYGEVVQFFRKHTIKIVVATIMTLLQRSSLFFLTWLIYRGMGLEQESIWTIMLLQAAVYIAVDMLPLPGSAGISELVYATVFASVFTGDLLTASLCLSRSISFYLVLVFSAGIWGISHLYYRRKKLKTYEERGNTI